MRQIYALQRWMYPLGLVLSMVACDANPTQPSFRIEPGGKTGPGQPASAVARLEISSFQVMEVGQSATLKFKAFDALGRELKNPAITWTPLTPGIVVIGSDGNARAEAAGAVQVVAQAGSAADTATLVALGPKSLLLTAFAGGSLESEVKPGQTISLPVVLDLAKASATGSIGSLQLDLLYDSNLLRFESAGAGASGASVANVVEPGRLRFAFAAAEAQGKPVVTLVTLTFQVSSSAAPGTQGTIGVSYAVPPTDTNFGPYELPITAGGIIRVAKG
jgi:hypothetical protein